MSPLMLESFIPLLYPPNSTYLQNVEQILAYLCCLPWLPGYSFSCLYVNSSTRQEAYEGRNQTSTHSPECLAKCFVHGRAREGKVNIYLNA